MTDRRLLILGAAIAMIAVGLLALQFPVNLNEFDKWGIQINCGNGFGAELLQASIADTTASSTQTSTRFTNACHTALTVRRVWAISLTVLGAAVLSWVAYRWVKPDETEGD